MRSRCPGAAAPRAAAKTAARPAAARPAAAAPPPLLPLPRLRATAGCTPCEAALTTLPACLRPWRAPPQGIDVAWSKIEADPNNLSHEQMRKIVDEISYGLGLDHPHVIKVRARLAHAAARAACTMQHADAECRVHDADAAC